MKLYSDNIFLNKITTTIVIFLCLYLYLAQLATGTVILCSRNVTLLEYLSITTDNDGIRMIGIIKIPRTYAHTLGSGGNVNSRSYQARVERTRRCVNSSL